MIPIRKLCLFAIAVSIGVSLFGCTPEGSGSAISGWENIGKSDDTSFVNPTPEDTLFFKTRGIVLGWSEVNNASVIDYIDIAKRNSLNTFSIYNAPMTSQIWKDFCAKCADAGIHIEYEEHMMSFLLPRDLFATHPEYFRMDKNGKRNADANGCPSSEGALREVYKNAIDIARRYVPTNHKYYFWLDDGGDICHCDKCKDLNASDQALIFENIALKAVRTIDPKATLAHLSYYNTLEPPSVIEPEDGIFLEFAPFFRTWDEPLANVWVTGRDGRITHAEYMKQLKANLKVFPVETAQVLEYWMDDSLFSGWDPNNLVAVPWKKAVFESDVKTYASLGIRNIMCYAAYVGPSYVIKFGYPDFLDEYGQGLLNYEE